MRLVCAEGGSRVFAPAGEALFFASPKKSTQKKGAPQSATPALRSSKASSTAHPATAPTQVCPVAQRRSDSHGESDHEAWALRSSTVSSAAHPATAPTQVCPVAQRRGRRLGGAFSLVTFFWRSKRKLLRRRAHSPAPAPRKGMKQKRPPALTNKAPPATKTGALITQPPAARATAAPTPQTSNKSPAS